MMFRREMVLWSDFIEAGTRSRILALHILFVVDKTPCTKLQTKEEEFNISTLTHLKGHECSKTPFLYIFKFWIFSRLCQNIRGMSNFIFFKVKIDKFRLFVALEGYQDPLNEISW